MPQHTTVYLPLEKAIILAARQNREHDRRNGERGIPFDTYIKEARYLLETTGENYEPTFEDHEKICVSNS